MSALVRKLPSDYDAMGQERTSRRCADLCRRALHGALFSQGLTRSAGPGPRSSSACTPRRHPGASGPGRWPTRARGRTTRPGPAPGDRSARTAVTPWLKPRGSIQARTRPNGRPARWAAGPWTCGSAERAFPPRYSRPAPPPHLNFRACRIFRWNLRSRPVESWPAGNDIRSEFP